MRLSGFALLLELGNLLLHRLQRRLQTQCGDLTGVTPRLQTLLLLQRLLLPLRRMQPAQPQQASQQQCRERKAHHPQPGPGLQPAGQPVVSHPRGP